MTYPNERVLMYKYDGSTVDSAISRLSYLGEDDGAGGVRRLEEYSYLGLSTIVKRAHTQPHVDLTYIKQTGESNGAAGDQYAGLDRFDRVVDQRWIKTSNTTNTDRFKYGYDESGNAMYKDNVLSSSNSELYHANGSTNGYDSLNRLAAFQRGALNTAKDSISGTVGASKETVSGASADKTWGLDTLGNWNSVTGETGNRTHDMRNEVTQVNGATLTFDNNGNTTKDENGYTYIYDAWNRLVKESITGYASQDRHGYDALGRRITTGNSANTIPDLYYSNQWQVLEERSGSTVKDQYVWSIAYVDAMVLRDRDKVSGGDLGKTGSGLDERLYVQQDANYNVTALVDISGAVVERFIYDPYGSVTVLDSSWAMKNDGAVADSDFNWVYLHQGGRFDDAGFGGLYSFGHRYYSPTLGRWMQQDPMEYVDGLNSHEYEVSNPLDHVDPLGTTVIVEDFGPMDALGHWRLGGGEAVRIVGHDFIAYVKNLPEVKAKISELKANLATKAAKEGGGLKPCESKEISIQRSFATSTFGWTNSRFFAFGTIYHDATATITVHKTKSGYIYTDNEKLKVGGYDHYHGFSNTPWGFRHVWYGINAVTGTLRDLRPHAPANYDIYWGWEEPDAPPTIGP